MDAPQRARYVEKLATPDVSVADLIGDIDPIKAANEGSTTVTRAPSIMASSRGVTAAFSPSTNCRICSRASKSRCSTSCRKATSRFAGFQMRLDLDIQFVFTANPEDYTNRGAIITPLKDRIQSQILTHYPASLDDAMSITDQEATWQPGQSERVAVPQVVRRVLERIAFEARDSEYIDEKSGVSARLPISALEHLMAAGRVARPAQWSRPDHRSRDGCAWPWCRRSTARWSSCTRANRKAPPAWRWRSSARPSAGNSRRCSPTLNPSSAEKWKIPISPSWRGSIARMCPCLRDQTDADYAAALDSVDGLRAVVGSTVPGVEGEEALANMEFVLHGLAAYNEIGQSVVGSDVTFGDLIGNLFEPDSEED